MAQRTTIPTTTHNPDATPKTENHTLDFFYKTFFPAKDLNSTCPSKEPSRHWHPVNNFTGESVREDFILYDIPKICAPKHLPKNWLHRDRLFEPIFLTVVILFCFISLVHLMVSASTFSDMKPRLLPVVTVSY
jgi:hypothetical protein